VDDLDDAGEEGDLEEERDEEACREVALSACAPSLQE